MRTLKGIAASTGIVAGKAYVYRPVELAVERWRVEDTEAELARLQSALEESKEQLSEIHVKAEVEVGEDTARIFEAHLLILDAPVLLEEVRGKIEKECLNAEAGRYSFVGAFPQGGRNVAPLGPEGLGKVKRKGAQTPSSTPLRFK